MTPTSPERTRPNRKEAVVRAFRRRGRYLGRQSAPITTDVRISLNDPLVRRTIITPFSTFVTTVSDGRSEESDSIILLLTKRQFSLRITKASATARLMTTGITRLEHLHKLFSVPSHPSRTLRSVIGFVSMRRCYAAENEDGSSLVNHSFSFGDIC